MEGPQKRVCLPSKQKWFTRWIGHVTITYGNGLRTKPLEGAWTLGFLELHRVKGTWQMSVEQSHCVGVIGCCGWRLAVKQLSKVSGFLGLSEWHLGMASVWTGDISDGQILYASAQWQNGVTVCLVSTFNSLEICDHPPHISGYSSACSAVVFASRWRWVGNTLHL